MGTDAVVVDVGTFVAAGHDDGFILAITVVALFEGFDEFVAGNVLDIRKTAETNFGEVEDVLILQECAQMGGVP